MGIIFVVLSFPRSSDDAFISFLSSFVSESAVSVTISGESVKFGGIATDSTSSFSMFSSDTSFSVSSILLISVELNSSFSFAETSSTVARSKADL